MTELIWRHISQLSNTIQWRTKTSFSFMSFFHQISGMTVTSFFLKILIYTLCLLHNVSWFYSFPHLFVSVSTPALSPNKTKFNRRGKKKIKREKCKNPMMEAAIWHSESNQQLLCSLNLQASVYWRETTVLFKVSGFYYPNYSGP